MAHLQLVHRTILLSLTATLPALLSSGCVFQECTANLVNGVEVIVPDPGGDEGGIGGAGGEGGPGGFDCSTVQATATDTGSGYFEKLACYSVESGCVCSGLPERPGSYTVSVRSGDEVEQQSVTVRSGACHVIPQTLTFFDQSTSD